MLTKKRLAFLQEILDRTTADNEREIGTQGNALSLTVGELRELLSYIAELKKVFEELLTLGFGSNYIGGSHNEAGYYETCPHCLRRAEIIKKLINKTTYYE